MQPKNLADTHCNLEDIEQEIERQITSAPRQVLLPGVRQLDELFSRTKVLHDHKGYKPTYSKVWDVPLKKKKKGQAFLETYCGVRGLPFDLDVTPHDPIIDLLERTMLICDMARIHFQMIVRGQGQTALITAQYGSIIGSHWLAIIDANQVKKLSNQ